MAYRLRELERGDIPTINGWRANRELIACLGAPYRFINREVDEAWFEAYMRSRQTCVRCAIVEDGRDDAPILGLVTLAGIDHLRQSATLHIMIGSADDRSKGMGTFAVLSMLKHAFYDLNLRRVELSVLATNAAAIGLYQKCGFTREGTRRQACFKGGEFVDMYEYGILRGEERSLA
ncbi:GNAT family N-acetyltransferase [Parafannyhessea umbonata]|jgi:RimJ/RimL family protein N-acetyltransferase|uniref:GNAT family N-acetyltransferase n=1 Tax=Parafannyhessea umbonata TaxID=604330 RepID=A0A6N7X9B5_9ACTN|nr:GNAT family protein [Parafannyhessea umbonata]MST59787.1 GNAT family N-acetyltransferase [Parafannyhessea umbonata]